ncbi:MAG: twitch domain-containing radical SAM protein [Bdellovibrionales bacterium]|nr:twitch domain-containing radical SAM protein [Bdellovibrionales bacterium]
MKPNLKTFCPLPWIHLSARSDGSGRLCCKAHEFPLKNNQGEVVFWQNSDNVHSYFNSEEYKKIRLQMLRGKQPSHCVSCFEQESHGGHSQRQAALNEYGTHKRIIDSLIRSTNSDGSIDHPKHLYLDMTLGNKCNLKCRMCHPWSSYIIGRDWKKMGKEFNEEETKKILQNEWYASPDFFQFVRSALPFVEEINTTGGEPFLIKEHFSILKMIIEEGHSDHISLRYNTNYTVIPDQMVKLWKSFKKVTVNCSVEACGELNDYIRYPSKWNQLEKNMYALDELAFQNPHINILIHTTLQAYNVLRIPEFLDWLRQADFKAVFRFPGLDLVQSPEWLHPGIYPQNLRSEIADKILESVDHHEPFFLNYNEGPYREHSRERIQILRDFSEMIRTDSSQERYFESFIKETKAHDTLRRQSVTYVLPELKPFFVD